MLNFLRFIKYSLTRAHDSVLGVRATQLKRLVKAGRVSVGAHTYGGPPEIKTFTHDSTRLTIGAYCSLSIDSLILLGGKHATDALTTYPHRILWQMEGAGEDGFPMASKDSFIGSDVWLCDKAVVVSGIRIGHGAIVGAGAVVTRDVPDYAIVGGNPAKVIRYRFEERERRMMLDLAWWDWPDEKVKEAVPMLASDDVDALAEFARSNGLGNLKEPGVYESLRQ